MARSQELVDHFTLAPDEHRAISLAATPTWRAT